MSETSLRFLVTSFWGCLGYDDSSSESEENPWTEEETTEHKQDEKKEGTRKIDKKSWKGRKNVKFNSNDNSVENFVLGNQWPAEGFNLYLDGNNMLFVLGPIRKLVLQGRRSEAELILQHLAQEFANKMELTRCTLIFDSTNKKVETPSFVVCSARPQYAMSDETLVSWASQPGGKGLSVTSTGN